MHVLITADTVGGVWTYTRELVAGLARRGIRVTLVSFGRIPSDAQLAWLNELPTVRYLATDFRLEWMADAQRDLDTSMCYLQAVVREARPDLLHLSQFCYGALDVGVPKVVVAHSDVFSWNEAVHRSLPTGAWAERYYRVVSQGLAGADLVIAPSRWMLDQMQLHYGALHSSQVIYNGRTPELFDSRQRKQPLAASAGRLWDEGKQSRLLMQLSPPPLPIALAGAKALDEERARAPEVESSPHICRQLAKMDRLHNGEHEVFCSGELSESAMRELLSRASIYIASSKYEPFGLAPLEAAFSGCALVANDIPSLREIWGEAALYFRNNDAASLADALALLHGSPELCQRYAALAYQRASRHYTAARMVDDYVRAYRALLEYKVRAA